MRRVTIVVVAVLLLGLATPVMAIPNPPTNAPMAGDRINVLTGTPVEYPAKTVFHVWQAWAADHRADLDEIRDTINDTGMRVELEIDGARVRMRPWFNVFDVDATCPTARQERILERITFARPIVRLADRWGCDVEGIWVKGYFRNFWKGLPAGMHDFRVSFLQTGEAPLIFEHTVEFTP
jgi:hypothetical protein